MGEPISLITPESGLEASSFFLKLPPALSVPGGYFWSLAFDPGVTTGWCVYRVPRVALVEDGFLQAMKAGGAFTSGEFRGGEDWMVDRMLAISRAVYSEVDEEAGDQWAILVEDFVVRMVKMERSFLSPVRLGHMFRRDMRNAPVLVDFRLSSDAMNIVTDGRLRHWNMYRPGSVHARDAQRHAIMTCRRYSSEPHLRTLVRARMADL
jgi:hypothetical protein